MVHVVPPSVCHAWISPKLSKIGNSRERDKSGFSIHRNTPSRRREPCAHGAPPSIIADDLVVPNCCEPCYDVMERCRAWWTGAAWSIHLTWPKRVCLLWLIASFMDGSCERVATMFVTDSYQKVPSIHLWFIIWKASSFAISAFNSVHVSEGYSSDDRDTRLVDMQSTWDITDEARPILLRISGVQ